MTKVGNVNCTIVRGGLPDVEEIVESVSVRSMCRLYVNNSSRIVRVQWLKTRAPSGFPVGDLRVQNPYCKGDRNIILAAWGCLYPDSEPRVNMQSRILG